MSTLRDQLNEHFDKADEEGGLSTLSLLSLPKAVNHVIRVFLRNRQVTYDQLLKTIEEMPEESRLSKADLDEMITVLTEREWLEKSELDGKDAYGINLRPTSMSPSAKREATGEPVKDKPEASPKPGESETPAAAAPATPAEATKAPTPPTVKIDKAEPEEKKASAETVVTKTEPAEATPAHTAETVPSMKAISKEDLKKRLAEEHKAKAEKDQKDGKDETAETEEGQEDAREKIRRKRETGNLKAGDLWDAIDL